MKSIINAFIRKAYRFAYLGLRGWWFVRRPQTHGAAVALWHDGRILLVRTSYRLRYSLPGGFVRRDEPSEQAARRELREELGIDLHAHALRLAWHGTVPFESRQDTIDIWETTTAAAPTVCVSGREIIWAGWATPAEALSYRLLPHVATYLRAVAGL